MKKRIVFLALLLLSAISCTEEKRAQGERANVSTTTASAEQFAAVDSPPDVDVYELTRRLRLRSSSPITKVENSPPPLDRVGDARTFWITEMEPATRFQINAVLRLATPHALWYVDGGQQVDQDALQASAKEFEDKIYPTVSKAFGLKGRDSQPITVLNSTFRGASGYFSSRDRYPRVVHPFSNERPIIYINVGHLKPGAAGYNATLAHEFQHALHWEADPNEESWVNEGLSVLAEEMAGYYRGAERPFARGPDVQLTDWDDDPGRNSRHYAASYLFMRYLLQHYSKNGSLAELVEEPLDGVEGVESYLKKVGYNVSFQEVFRDWVVANYLSAGGNEPRRYKDRAVGAVLERSVSVPVEISDKVQQYGTKYYEVKSLGPKVTISFDGDTTVKILPNQPVSGSYQWWSNRGDAVDTTLTREFDLTGLKSATLQYKLWHDLEEGWDYAYVEVSSDGGVTWDILQSERTTSSDPVGNSYGPGYTGVSGSGDSPAWVDEKVDLSTYAGRNILVRFEYVTDEAVNKVGLALDDISIPELGYRDDAESDGGWASQGFVRTLNLLPQRYLVQLIKFHKGGDVRVEEMPLSAEQRGMMALENMGGEIERVVVAISPTAPVTTESASFHLTVNAQ
ncbi:MAG: hypothetical protein HW403_675 [Dehalococcoidia bacterium]|nr:hypothetical protein [Dehalococcoidia bacterium]